MCFSNCKYENFNGECIKPKNAICPDTIEDSFICEYCGETTPESENSLADGVCQECYENQGYTPDTDNE